MFDPMKNWTIKDFPGVWKHTAFIHTASDELAELENKEDPRIRIRVPIDLIMSGVNRG